MYVIVYSTVMIFLGMTFLVSAKIRFVFKAQLALNHSGAGVQGRWIPLVNTSTTDGQEFQ